MKIKKVLIANRGEIAIRVMKTCKRLGIETVSLYSDEDRFLPHVSFADTALALGGGTLADTYLNQDKIIELSKKHHVDAIHPGYGFLSENTAFCEKVSANGIIFIGPSVEAISLMGDKKDSKVKMEELGTPLVPGYHGDEQDENLLVTKAQEIGFPVLIKATAGGGGKGMRIVRDSQRFTQELAAAKREAKNAFGNDKVLIEKYIEKPRHIEVQIVSDSHGNHLHFFERECSIQRRYQKIIEETPSAALDQALREKICQTAVEIAKGIHYLGAGTVEFILAQDGSFYFLEMNTRLQVEHPITEMVTGVDLVEMQLIVAAGESLPLKQEAISQTGHAIECRIYAENPDNDFLPTAGRIRRVGGDHSLRLDTGYKDGNIVSTLYDPMLAKLIVHDKDRSLANAKMLGALNRVFFSGIETNRNYLKRFFTNAKYLNGDIHTHFIHDEKLEKIQLTLEQKAQLIAAVLMEKNHAKMSFFHQVHNRKDSQRFIINDEEVLIDLKESQKDLTFEMHGVNFSFAERDLLSIYCCENEVNSYQVYAPECEAQITYMAKVAAADSESISAGSLLSPMPGKIFKLLKSEGDQVEVGEPIMILEAMKMEHTIKANEAGVIKKILFKEGAQVNGGVSLAEIES